MNNTKKGIVFLLGATLVYSIIPVLIRSLDAGDVPPMSQVFLRYIFAFISAGIYFIFIKKEKLSLKTGNWKLLLLAGAFGYGLANLLFTYGIIYTDVANALFLFYSFGIITPILGFLILREKINKYNVISLIIGATSLLFLFTPTSVSTWKLGGILAFGSALTQSFYLVSRKKLKEYSSALVLFTSTFLGMLLVGSLALIFENNFYFGEAEIKSMEVSTWILTILFGIGNFSAWYFMSKGFEYVKATTGSLVLLTENVLAISFVFLFFQEVPSVMAIFGGLLIVFASILVILKGDNS